jgi:hypothetical protein
MKVRKVFLLTILVLVITSMVITVSAYIPPDFEFPAGYLVEQVLAPLISKPLAIAINSDGEIFVTGHDDGDVYHVHEDGSVTSSVYSVGIYHRAMDFDTEDNLYVVSDTALWKVAPDGTATLLVSDFDAYQLVVGPSGDIFALGPGTTDVLRVTPGGVVSVYATGFIQANDVEVNPITGEVYVADWGTGDIFRANPDGTITPISAGPADNTFIAISPEGKLYASYNGGLLQVSYADGTRTILPWASSGGGSYNCDLTISLIEFDQQGRIVSGDYTLGDIARLNLEEETIEVLVQGNVNPTALAVAPNEGGVYIGQPSKFCNGNGKILHVESDGSTNVIVDDLPPNVTSIAFDSNGLGYASCGDGIYTFTTGGITNRLLTEPNGPQKLAIDPTTNLLWGAGYDYLWHLDATDQLVKIPYPVEQATHSPRLAFTPDGTAYVYTCERDDPNLPKPGIYSFNPDDSSFTMFFDFAGTPYECTGGAMTASQDGYLYWMIYDVLKFTPSGDWSIFAVIPGGDTLEIVSDPDNTDLYFGNAAGIFRVFEANLTFLPLIVRN